MNSPRCTSFTASWIPHLLSASLLLCSLGLPAMAEPPVSRLPVFGPNGVKFSKDAKDSHTITGWLPKDWWDNSRWAAVSATYTRLTDSPDKDAGAVRIEVAKVDNGQLQLTTFKGDHEYKKGTKYVVTGWVRSPLLSTIKIGFRDLEEPYPFFDQVDLTTTGEWKRFEYPFTPDNDCDAWLMFVMNTPGTVDLAGVTVEEK